MQLTPAIGTQRAGMIKPALTQPAHRRQREIDQLRGAGFNMLEQGRNRHAFLVEQIGRMCNICPMITVFDRPLLRRRRDRAAADYAQFRFLLDEVGARLCERLQDIRRQFPQAIVLGAGDGTLARTLTGHYGIEHLIQLELSNTLATQAQTAGPVAVADEEFLPIKAASANLIISNLVLHWVNDLPGALLQIRHALQPDGLFVASVLGGDTLIELRRCLMEAEIELCGGAAPRLSPLTEIRDVGGLLQRAGFTLPAADRETITVTYSDPLRLLYDLRGMGATNALLARTRTPLRRGVLGLALHKYRTLYADTDGRVPASFEVITMTGWAAHESQQQPLRRGSATTRLADALGTTEHKTGDKPL